MSVPASRGPASTAERGSQPRSAPSAVTSTKKRMATIYARDGAEIEPLGNDIPLGTLPGQRARGSLVAMLRAQVIVLVVCAGCGARTDLNVARRDGGVAGDARVEGRDAEAACDQPVALEAVRADLMFVLDRSGSMDFRLGAGSSTRSTVLRDGLGVTLPAFDASSRLRALLYPVRAAARMTVCDVPPTFDVRLGASASMILDALDAHPPAGGTPTAEALSRAYDALATARAPVVVLATDGGPNCDPADRGRSHYGIAPESCIDGGIAVATCLDDERTLAFISEALADGIPTYVIGMDVTLDLLVDVLSRMAVAGGRRRPFGLPFYDVGRPEDMRQALETIAGEVSRCAFVDPGGNGDVHVDGLRTDDWRRGPNATIELQADACARARDGVMVTFVPRCD